MPSRLRFRLAKLRGIGEVQSALTEDASDIGVTAGQSAQTKSSPTTSIKLTLSASPASDTSGVSADDSGCVKQLDTCTASLHKKEDQLQGTSGQLAECEEETAKLMRKMEHQTGESEEVKQLQFYEGTQ